ncbi:hypothetical protein ILUMI_23524, partial [Ignelater luminosus]
MPQAKHLNINENDLIMKLRRQNWSTENYVKKKRSGHPVATSAHKRRAIIEQASNSALTAKQIAESVGVSTSIRTFERILKDCEHLQCKTIMTKLMLSLTHKEARMALANEPAGEMLYL